MSQYAIDNTSAGGQPRQGRGKGRGKPRFEKQRGKGARCLCPYILVLMLAATVSLLFGCGYTSRSTLPANIKTIHIAMFKNNIDFSAEGQRNLYLPLLEVKTRNAIVNRFLFDGSLKIADADTADLVLKGQLTGYDRTALRYTDNDDVQEYRIHITVSLELRNTNKDEASWTEPGFTGETTYFTTGASARTEEAAVEDAFTDLARRIVERTIEDW